MATVGGGGGCHCIPLNVTKNNCLSGLPIYPFSRFTIPRTTSQTTWHLSFYREKARVADLIQEVESRLPRENSIALNHDLCLPFLFKTKMLSLPQVIIAICL